MPVIAEPVGQTRPKLAVLMLSGAIASLKLAVIAVLMATIVAPLTGNTVLTIGAVVSGAALVVKLHAKGAVSILPATSRTGVVIVAVQVVLEGSGLLGVKLATLPLMA